MKFNKNELNDKEKLQQELCTLQRKIGVDPSEENVFKFYMWQKFFNVVKIFQCWACVITTGVHSTANTLNIIRLLLHVDYSKLSNEESCKLFRDKRAKVGHKLTNKMSRQRTWHKNDSLPRPHCFPNTEQSLASPIDTAF